MVLIESNEILLSSALAGRLAADFPGIAIHPLRGGLPGRNKRPAGKYYPFVKCFVISEYPFNVYGIYEQIKGAVKEASSSRLPLDMHIVLKLGVEDVSVVQTIRKHCSYLYKLFCDLPWRDRNAPEIRFSCVYNLFGAVRDAVIQPGNNSVQGLLFLLKHTERQVLVPFGKGQEVIGTDVDQAVPAILDGPAGSARPEELVPLPVNVPVEAGLLLSELAGRYPGKYQSIQYMEDARLDPARVKSELGAGTSGRTLTESFLTYLAP